MYFKTSMNLIFMMHYISCSFQLWQVAVRVLFVRFINFLYFYTFIFTKAISMVAKCTRDRDKLSMYILHFLVKLF